MSKITKLIMLYPFSTVCIILIWILCFCTTPTTPLDNVPFIDKWTHLVMYGGTCSVMWIETLRRVKANVNLKQMFLWVWMLPVLMSGTIELLQAYCTGGRRSGDWMDFFANSLGATLGFVFGYMICHHKYKHGDN